MRKSFFPVLLTLTVGLGTIVVLGQSTRPAASAKKAVAGPAATFEATVQPFMAQTCAGCHNDKVTSGSLNLSQFKTRASIAANRERWDVILKKMKGGEMPPPPMPRPDQARLHATTTWIEGELDRLDRLAAPNPGRVTARRLNRAEYNYTVKDLLGVDYRPANDFPQDDTGYGFDTIGDVLSLSVVQMEKYLSAAETVARTAVYGPQVSKPVVARYQLAGRRRPGDFDNLFFNSRPWLSVNNYDESGLSMPNAFHVVHRFPANGEYVIRVTPENGSRPPGSEPLEVGAWADGKLVGTSSIDGPLEARTQEFRVKLTSGEHWIAGGFPRQFEGLPVAYMAKNPSKRPVPVGGRGGRGGGRGGAAAAAAAAAAAGGAAPNLAGAPGGGTPLAGPPGQPPPNPTGAPPGDPGLTGPPGRGGGRGGAGRGGAAAAAANNNDDAASSAFYTPAGAPPGTRLARPDNMGVQSLEISGPHNPEIRPSEESLKTVFICDLKVAGCDRKIIANLARNAYRRPVIQLEIDELMAQMARVKKRGDSPEEQLVVGIQAILVSPNFLFRVEKDAAKKAEVPRSSLGALAAKPANRASAAAASESRQLSNLELASRLSYFLWSSMPDAELLRAAEQGTLRRPEVLNAQVKRMMADAKISRFVENFGGQWLQFRGLESHQPDFYLYPAFDNYLRNSMVRETQMFFENMIREDRPILDFLDADYTFVNEYLGQYYGMRDVKGIDFRKVSLVGTPRRGILGQGSMLTISSYGNRTSVVLRGKWVLENLLNAPPPPPPANVPDIEEAKVDANATLRQRMEAHREHIVCAGCHSKMDPIGFGLENFDAVGNWRDKDGKSPINASGILPDGRSFNGPVELAKILRSESGAFSECLTEKMLIYGIGRGIEPYDRPALQKITAGVKSGDYRFSSMVLGIVNSVPFQMRKGERP